MVALNAANEDVPIAGMDKLDNKLMIMLEACCDSIDKQKAAATWSLHWLTSFPQRNAWP